MWREPLLSRRFVTLGAAAAATSAGASWARPQQSPAIPQVDRLTLHTIVDNATFGPFLGDQTLPGLRVERASGGGGGRMPRHALMAEFGLSVMGESVLGSDTRKIMIDFGYSPEVLANNLALLGIDPDGLDAAVLSHGHLDHYGGFPGLFSRGAPRQVLPLIVGGEETFCERAAMIGEPPPVMGTLDRDELARAGFAPRIAAEPMIVADHAFTTGLIPLEGFERAAIPTRMRPGVGCSAASLSAAKRDLTEVADDGEHELATCYSLKGLGLVVIASCSHRGVLNSVRRAQAISGVERVHAVIGGFHLVRPRTDEEARRTVAEFAGINPAYIIPMHCTGEVFISEAMRVMPEKVIRPYVGTRFVFGAA